MNETGVPIGTLSTIGSQVTARPSQHTIYDGLLSMGELLVRAGSRIRSKTRADCVQCSGHSHSTVSFTRTVAFCHRCKWTRNIPTLAREVGLLHVDPALRATLDREAQERRQLYGLAVELGDAVRIAESEARREIWELASLRRRTGQRLRELSDGDPEKLSGEAELCWDALQFVADHELRAHAAYTLSCLAAPPVQARWALHPTDRAALVEAALELGWVAGKRGYFQVGI